MEEYWNSKMEFEETELRLCLPGGGGGPGDGGEVVEANNNKETNANGKRSCPHTSMVDLKLKLASNEATTTNVNIPKQKELLFASNQPAVKLSPAKAQVVGWPPVQSFRKNKLAVVVEKSSLEGSDKVSAGSIAALVKVSMEGAPYLRKVDLNMYNNYRELSDALANKFHSFAAAAAGGGECESHGMMDFMNESKLNNLSNSSDYVPTYEDKDGDWMVVGDVPWEMFVASCKRLRIMKGAEAIGLAPRALQAECKNSQKKLNM